MSDNNGKNTARARAQEKEDKKNQKRQNRSKRMGSKPHRSGGGIPSKIFLVTILLAIGFALATGLINQRKTGEALQQYYVNWAYKIGDQTLRVFNGDKDNMFSGFGLHQTENGVYLDGKDGGNGQNVQNPGAENGAPVVN